MFSKLVKRSKFKKVYVSDTSPVEMLVEGDEVYISFCKTQPANAFGQVEFIRQTEREQSKVEAFGSDNLHPHYPSILSDGLPRVSLAARSGMAALSVANQSYMQEGVNLLCGFSDYVKFQLPAGQVGAAELLIETITYETSR